MIRGTTAQFKFNLPYDSSMITAIVVTFWQKHHTGSKYGTLPITKTYICTSGEVTNNGGFGFSQSNAYEVQTYLTAQETLRFSDQEKAYVQIKVNYTTNDGLITVASKLHKLSVYPILNDENPGIIDPSTPSVDDIYIFDAGEI